MKEQLFHRLYDEYHQDVFRFLMYLVKNRDVAEDLSHEVYVKVLKSYDQFEKKSSEKTWLFAIAKNVAIDYFRKQAVKQKHAFQYFDWEKEQLISSEYLPEELYMLSESKIQLLALLNEITGDQKMVTIMRYINGLSVQETAQILDWTESKVKTTQHRALKNLRKKLQLIEKEANSL